MLTTEEYMQMKEEKIPCPYGRKTSVGATRCVNCHFNRIGSNKCYGNAEAVRWLQRRLQLDY